MLVLLLLISCAHGPRYPGPTRVVRGYGLPRPATERRTDGLGHEAARAAAYYLDHDMSGFRDDCSGFVCAAYTRAGIPLEGNAASLWELATQARAVHHRSRPSVGDLAFFDDTYDRDRDGRTNDELTHIAVVMRVEDDGTIVLAHGGTSRGRTELRMNVRRPDERADESGRVLNDYLRIRRDSDEPGTKYLAGELWRGFATVDPREWETWAPSN